MYRSHVHFRTAILAVVMALLAVPAAADDNLKITDVFPEGPLLPDVAERVMTAELLGPPATMYDSRTRTFGAGDPLAIAVEKRIFGKRWERLAAPDALRRFATIMDAIRRYGDPMDLHMMFVAEHVGLSDVPGSGGTFMTSAEDAERIADLAGSLIKDLLKDDSLRSVAVVLRRDEERRLTTGTIWFLRGGVDFEPFARRWAPGQRASIPGLQLSEKNAYELWVGISPTEVHEFPIVGAEGRFDIEVPLPAEPGVYRVAMSIQKKRRMPDSPFFFSLYVGVDPPLAFHSPLKVQEVGVGTDEDFEDQVVELINRSRVELGLSALDLVGQPERIRAIVREAPRKDAARYRYYRNRLLQDPLPDQPHGRWHPTFASGFLPADAAWLALENPISRSALLDPDVTSLAYGAVAMGAQRSVLLVALEPPPDAASAGEAAFDLLSAKVPKGLTAAPELEAELAPIAARIASGKMPVARFFGPIRRIFKKGDLIGGAVNATALVLPPAHQPELAEFKIPAGAKYAAIGEAVGDLGRGEGIQYTVLVVAVATHAK